MIKAEAINVEYTCPEQKKSIRSIVRNIYIDLQNQIYAEILDCYCGKIHEILLGDEYHD